MLTVSPCKKAKRGKRLASQARPDFFLSVSLDFYVTLLQSFWKIPLSNIHFLRQNVL